MSDYDDGVEVEDNSNEYRTSEPTDYESSNVNQTENDEEEEQYEEEDDGSGPYSNDDYTDYQKEEEESQPEVTPVDEGSENFDSLLRCVENGLITEDEVDVIVEVLNGLVDGKFFASNNIIIKDPNCILQMIEQIDKNMSQRQEAVTWNFFTEMINKSMRNLVACQDVLLLDIILKRLDKSDGTVMEKLIDLISVLMSYSASVDQLRLLMSMLQGRKKEWPNYSLKLLQAIIVRSQKTGPLNFFHFPGWPASGISLPPIDRWPNKNGWTFHCWFQLDPVNSVLSDVECNYLYYFYTTRRTGFSCHFTGGSLVITVMTSEGKGFQHCIEYNFQPRCLYMITLVHARSKKFVLCYINGRMVSNARISWAVRLSDRFEKCFLGCSPEKTAETAFSGQILAVCCFAQALSSNQITFLYENGPSQDVTDENLVQLLMFQYSPTKCDEFLCLESSPNSNLYFVGSPHAQMEVILPLFRQLDYKLPKGNDQSICAPLMQLVYDMLESSEILQQQMLQCKGFECISSMLEMSTAKHITMDLFNILFKMTNFLARIPNGAALLKQHMDHMLFNPQLWINANVDVQLRLWKFLANDCVTNDDIFMTIRRLSSVVQILHSIKYYYWIENPKDRSRISPRGVDGIRPSNANMIILRAEMLNYLLALFVKGLGVQKEELQAFLNFLSTVQEEKNMLDVLEVTVKMMELFPSSMVPVFDLVGGVCTIFQLFQANGEKIRILSLRLLCLYLTQSVVKRQRETMEQYNLYSLLVVSLKKFPMTMEIYRLLFYMVIGNVGTDSTDRVAPQSQSTTTIENPQMLKVIAQLLWLSDSNLRMMEAKMAFLKDLVVLCSSSKENRRSVLKMELWQDWLFSLCYIYPRNATERVVTNTVLFLFHSLLHHAFKHETGGWHVWIDTVSILHSRISFFEYKIQSTEIYQRYEMQRERGGIDDVSSQPPSNDSKAGAMLNVKGPIHAFNDEVMYLTTDIVDSSEDQNRNFNFADVNGQMLVKPDGPFRFPVYTAYTKAAGKNRQLFSRAPRETAFVIPDFRWSCIHQRLLSDLLQAFEEDIALWKNETSKPKKDFANDIDNSIFVMNVFHMIIRLMDDVISACGGILPLLCAATSQSGNIDMSTREPNLGIRVMEASGYLHRLMNLTNILVLSSTQNFAKLETEENMTAGSIMRQCLRLSCMVTICNCLENLYRKAPPEEELSRLHVEALMTGANVPEIKCFEHRQNLNWNLILQEADVNCLQGIIAHDFQEKKQSQFLALSSLYFLAVILVSSYLAEQGIYLSEADNENCGNDNGFGGVDNDEADYEEYDNCGVENIDENEWKDDNDVPNEVWNEVPNEDQDYDNYQSEDQNDDSVPNEDQDDENYENQVTDDAIVQSEDQNDDGVPKEDQDDQNQVQDDAIVQSEDRNDDGVPNEDQDDQNQVQDDDIVQSENQNDDNVPNEEQEENYSKQVDQQDEWDMQDDETADNEQEDQTNEIDYGTEYTGNTTEGNIDVADESTWCGVGADSSSNNDIENNDYDDDGYEDQNYEDEVTEGEVSMEESSAPILAKVDNDSPAKTVFKTSVSSTVLLIQDIIQNFKPYLSIILAGEENKDLDPKIITSFKKVNSVEGLAAFLLDKDLQSTLQKNAGLAFLELINEGRQISHFNRDYILTMANQAQSKLKKMYSDDLCKHAQHDTVCKNKLVQRREEEQICNRLITLDHDQDRTRAFMKMENIFYLMYNSYELWQQVIERPPIYWRLDSWEDCARRRRRFVRNVKGNSHPEVTIMDRDDYDKEVDAVNYTKKTLLTHLFKNQDIQAKGDKNVEKDERLDALTEKEVGMEFSFDSIFEISQRFYLGPVSISTNCLLIIPGCDVKGVLTITKTQFFYELDPIDARKKSVDYQILQDIHNINGKWHFNEITGIFLRRYLLQSSCAIEIFLASRSGQQNAAAIMFAFSDVSMARKVVNALPEVGVGFHLPQMPKKRYISLAEPDKLFRMSSMRFASSALDQASMLGKWQRREISNFEYLMYLNTIAGRSYNDLNQYPVFPWVISNYESSVLDLSLPGNYRDLSKPVGILNPSRRSFFEQRYKAWSHPNIPPFHYGTHYSTAASTLAWLFRVEPFTTFYLKTQNGKFLPYEDMFNSIAKEWKSCLTDTSDVRELIPEFFYLPEMLVNSNKYNFGNDNNDGNVSLPPWADSPEDFIRLNRMALESEIVSSQLHQWIDLIFGYKQQGRAAEKATNVFFYLMYQDSIQLQGVNDPGMRREVIKMIEKFGQVPALLLTEPHPPRNAVNAAPHITRTLFSMPPEEIGMIIKFTSASSIVHITCNTHPKVPTPTVITVAASYNYAFNAYQNVGSQSLISGKADGARKLPVIMDPCLDNPKAGKGVCRTLVSRKFDQNISVSNQNFVMMPNNVYMLVVGYMDKSFQVVNTVDGASIQVIMGHADIVTVISRSERNGNGDFLIVTGSKDCQVMLWLWTGRESRICGDNRSVINPMPWATLMGHSSPIVSVLVSAKLGIVVSASEDGPCIVHSTTGHYLWHLVPPAELFSPSLLSFSVEGFILVSYLSGHICSYRINSGRYHKQLTLTSNIWSMIVSQDGQYILIAGETGIVEVWGTNSMSLLYTYPQCESTVQSLCLTHDERYLMVGLGDGSLVVFEH